MLVLVSVLIAATLSGVIGALLAIPAAAAVQIVVRDVWQQRKTRPAPAESREAQPSDCFPGGRGDVIV